MQVAASRTQITVSATSRSDILNSTVIPSLVTRRYLTGRPSASRMHGAMLHLKKKRPWFVKLDRYRSAGSKVHLACVLSALQFGAGLLDGVGSLEENQRHCKHRLAAPRVCISSMCSFLYMRKA